jgi:hypothetical protein
MISTRHIRHDWKTFIDWDQRSVRTLCGRTSQQHLCGIPGVTEQPKIVEAGGKKKWGWCGMCIMSMMYEVNANESYYSQWVPEVQELWKKAVESVFDQYFWLKEKRNPRSQKNNSTTA